MKRFHPVEWVLLILILAVLVGFTVYDVYMADWYGVALIWVSFFGALGVSYVLSRWPRK